MRILFLTLLDFTSIEGKGIYTDLMREFAKAGHEICIISPNESKENSRDAIIVEGNTRILKIQVGKTQKTSLFKKGISTIVCEFFIRMTN